MNEIENDNLESNCVPRNSNSKNLFNDHTRKNIYNGMQMNNALESLHLCSCAMTNGSNGHDEESEELDGVRGLSPTLSALPCCSQHIHTNCISSHNYHYKDAHASTSKMHLVRNLVEEALENFENSLRLQEQPHNNDKIVIISYESELQMPDIMRLIQKDLSEPYSIYTYRFFIHNWPKLCFLAMHTDKCVGAIVCKLDIHRNVVRRGYIAMLAVDENYRKKKIGSRLVQRAIEAMLDDDADEVVLETEISNKPALKLYENLGFVRDKRLFRYYLNGVDALRLKLWLR